jgi:hypothetical protein
MSFFQSRGQLEALGPDQHAAGGEKLCKVRFVGVWEQPVWWICFCLLELSLVALSSVIKNVESIGA